MHVFLIIKKRIASFLIFIYTHLKHMHTNAWLFAKKTHMHEKTLEKLFTLGVFECKRTSPNLNIHICDRVRDRVQVRVRNTEFKI